MKLVFDLVEEIYDRISEYLFETGEQPRTVTVSPHSYRRLLEIWQVDPLNLGYLATLSIRIDELLPDTEVRVEG
jgi:hypothetical protein